MPPATRGLGVICEPSLTQRAEQHLLCDLSLQVERGVGWLRLANFYADRLPCRRPRSRATHCSAQNLALSSVAGTPHPIAHTLGECAIEKCVQYLSSGLPITLVNGDPSASPLAMPASRQNRHWRNERVPGRA